MAHEARSCFHSQAQWIITAYMIGPCQLLSRQPVRKVEDFKGMKLRGPTNMYQRITKRLGGVQVQLAGPELFTAMDKDIIDATWAIWEMSFAFKLKEPTKYILETGTSTSTHILAMNHRTWWTDSMYCCVTPLADWHWCCLH